ncbi:hypothetical protein [Yeosuana marina]|uniref:hypothetical protein n=1 Tax=Yeosuana marina TaxID=1565536 RepID=UPI00141E1A73|nr:hypothetical protein [Yeosuana marina]
MTFQKIFFPNKPFLFKKKITDPKFGLMWFNQKRGTHQSHYQCQIIFEPNKSVVDVFFYSEKDGINKNQKVLFQEIEEKYVDIIEKFSPKIIDIIKKQENNIDILDFKNEFKLNAIFIPNNSNGISKFRLRYEYNKNPLTSIIMEIENWKLMFVQTSLQGMRNE